MPKQLRLAHFNSDQGSLRVFEGLMPGSIKRIYYITDVPVDSVRGGHRHHRTWQALVCIKGRCRVYVNDGVTEQTFWLDQPESCLLLEPQDWHTMDSFSEDAILLVMANEMYDVNDYIDEPYT